MNFSETISQKLTEIITNELNYDEEKKEIIAYAIETALLFILGALILILLGYSLKALKPTVIAAIFGGLLRRVSGGAHFSTPTKCLAFGSIAYSFLGVLTNQIVSYNLMHKPSLYLSILGSLFLVAYLAPVDSEAKPIHSTSLRFKLKVSSVGFLICTFLIVLFNNNVLVNVSVVLGVVYQSLTLLPIFNRKRGELQT